MVQSPTLVFRMGGVDRDALIRGCQDWNQVYREWLDPYPGLREKFLKRLPSQDTFIFGGFASLVQKAIDDGVFHSPQTRVIGVKTHIPDQFLAVTTRILGLDPTNVESLTDAYVDVYRQIPEHLHFFRAYVPGFQNAYLLEIAPLLGIRESRRIMGDHVLSAEEILSAYSFDDAVAMGGYHIDIHRPSGTRVDSRDVPAYQIPFRSLIARDVDGLLMAGKCLSATHEAVASTRVIPICMAQGQAVGTAAALAVNRGVSARDVPIRALQATLIDQGAELGQSLGEPDPAVIDAVGQLPKTSPSANRPRVPADLWLR